MAAYYNEIEPFAAEWLRNLIAKGLIAPGDVDTRSIVDVRPDDIKGYEQCHFFAGIGGWSHALRLAGWPDERPVWTGSCPCQPFSAAGKGKAADDERHLAPAWLSLIAECRPRVVFGEQVEAAIGWGWLDFVFDALEAEGYACGAAVLPACGVGAPHIRNRLYFVADTDSRRRSERSECYGNTPQPGKQAPLGDDTDGCGVMVDAILEGLEGLPGHGNARHEPGRLRADTTGSTTASSRADREGMDDSASSRLVAAGKGSEDQARNEARLCGLERGRVGIVADTDGWHARAEGLQRSREHGLESQDGRVGFWSDVIWLPCRDGKARPTKPGLFPLLDGLSASLGRMRAIEASGWKEIESYGHATKRDPDEVLRMVREAVQSAAGREASGAGVLQQLHAPALLLAFLLCLDAARNGAAERSGFEKASDETRQRIVRGVRLLDEPGRPSRQRRPDGQLAGESADPLLALSLVLARHAEAYREAGIAAHAASGRTGQLRGAGNAISPQVAEAFIRAYDMSA